MHAIVTGLIAALWATFGVLLFPALGYYDRPDTSTFWLERFAAYAMPLLFILNCGLTWWWNSR